MVDEGQRMFAEGLVSSFVLFAQFDQGTHIFKVTVGVTVMAIYQHNPSSEMKIISRFETFTS